MQYDFQSRARRFFSFEEEQFLRNSNKEKRREKKKTSEEVLESKVFSLLLLLRWRVARGLLFRCYMPLFEAYEFSTWSQSNKGDVIRRRVCTSGDSTSETTKRNVIQKHRSDGTRWLCWQTAFGFSTAGGYAVQTTELDALHQLWQSGTEREQALRRCCQNTR